MSVPPRMFARFIVPAVLLIAGLTTPHAAADGEISWRVAFEGTYSDFEPVVGPDGTIYTGNADLITAVSPAGDVLWSVPATARQGTIAATSTAIHAVTGGDTIIALDPATGAELWSFTGGATIVGGPAADETGNIYAVADVSDGGIGMFSLTPAGALRWAEEGDPPLSDFEGNGHRMTITGDRVLVTLVPGVGNPPPTIWAFDLDGEQQYLLGDGCAGQLAVGPDGMLATGNGLCQELQVYNPIEGSLDLSVDAPSMSPCSGLANVAVGPDGSLYSAFCYRAFWAVDASGTQKWFIDDFSTYFWMDFLGVAPDNSVVLDLGRDPGVHGWVRAFSTEDGSLIWQIDLPNEDGSSVRSVTRPVFDAARGRVYFNATRGVSGTSYLYAIDLDPNHCPPDVNRDGFVGLADLLAVIAAWGQPDADIDRDGVTGLSDLLEIIGNWGASCTE